MTTSNVPSSDIDSYLNNINTIKSAKEARKYQFVRLVSFKEFMKNTSLPTTIMANLGFYYDPKTSSIKCCECEFKYTNLKSANVRPIVIQHYDQYPKCENIEKQKEFLNEFLEHQSLVFDDNQEKVRKFMEKKENRVKSFENVPLFLSIPSLVENGFYVDKDFNSNSSLIKINCVFCEYECIVFKNYHLNSNYEDPSREHRMKSPNCQIFNDSMDLGKNETSNRKSVQILKIIDSIQDNQMGKSILYNNDENFDILKIVLNETVNAVCDKPFHPGYATEQLRLESFKDWPLSMTQIPKDMAKAGFYYFGCKDEVKCFFCNGGLANWGPNDQPTWEHVRWFPNCIYIRQFVGTKFFDEVKGTYKDQKSGFTDDFDDNPRYYGLASNGQAVNHNQNATNDRFEARDNPPVVNQPQVEVESYEVNKHYDLTLYDDESPQSDCLNLENQRPANNMTQIKRTRITPSSAVSNSDYINSKFDLPTIRDVMKSGIKGNTLKRVIEKKLKEDGKDYDNMLELVKACMVHEDDVKELVEQFGKLVHLYIPNIPGDVNKKQIIDLFKREFNITATVHKGQDFALISLPDDELHQLDAIVDNFNKKTFPGSKSFMKMLVKKTLCPDLEMKSGHPKVDNNGDLEEFERAKKEGECVVCKERVKNVMFLPCAHLAACVECGVSLSTCPICRTNVKAAVLE